MFIKSSPMLRGEKMRSRMLKSMFPYRVKRYIQRKTNMKLIYERELVVRKFQKSGSL